MEAICEIVERCDVIWDGGIGEQEKIVVRASIELKELIPKFLENLQKDIKVILAALEEDDFQTLQFMGHNLKGAGGSYGFYDITDIGSYLEQAAKKSRSEEIFNLVYKLSTYLERVEVVYY